MKKLLLALVLIFGAPSAYGEIYTWVDFRGTAHYTNSPDEIPARYRVRAKVLDLGVEQKAAPASAPPMGASGAVLPQAAPSQPLTATQGETRVKQPERKSARAKRRGTGSAEPDE